MYTEGKDKLAAIFSYLGWILWIVAFIIRNKDDRLSRLHLNQGFILNIAATICGWLVRFHGLFGLVGLIGSILGLGVIVLSILGLVRAVRESDEPLPLIGEANIL